MRSWDCQGERRSKMTITEYHIKIQETGFIEYPSVISGDTILVEEIIKYEDCDLALKTYIAEMIMKRCFTPSNNCLGNDIDWYLNNFSKDYEADLIEPWRTGTIKEAINMIMSDDVFTQGIIATTYMFGVVEFYAKYLLGWRPNEYDFFDSDSHKPYREMYINQAINKLKKIKSALAESLNRIDKYNIGLLKENFIEEDRFVKAKIADRLLLARNTMLHGEKHSFYNISKYLIMIYAIFHLYRLQEK